MIRYLHWFVQTHGRMDDVMHCLEGHETGDDISGCVSALAQGYTTALRSRLQLDGDTSDAVHAASLPIPVHWTHEHAPMSEQEMSTFWTLLNLFGRDMPTMGSACQYPSLCVGWQRYQ